MVDTLEWSGQDVIQRMEPKKAIRITKQLSRFYIWPKGLYGMWRKINTFMCMFVFNPLFDNFMTLCVLVNSICLALDRYGIPEEEEAVLTQMNNIFTYIFIFEFGAKIFT